MINKIISFYKGQKSGLKINFKELRTAWHKNRLNPETELLMSEYYLYSTFIKDLEALKNEKDIK